MHAKALGLAEPKYGLGLPLLQAQGGTASLTMLVPRLSKPHPPGPAGEPHLFSLHSFFKTMENSPDKPGHREYRGSFPVGPPGLAWLKNQSIGYSIAHICPQRFLHYNEMPKQKYIYIYKSFFIRHFLKHEMFNLIK